MAEQALASQAWCPHPCHSPCRVPPRICPHLPFCSPEPTWVPKGLSLAPSPSLGQLLMGPAPRNYPTWGPTGLLCAHGCIPGDRHRGIGVCRRCILLPEPSCALRGGPPQWPPFPARDWSCSRLLGLSEHGHPNISCARGHKSQTLWAAQPKEMAPMELYSPPPHAVPAPLGGSDKDPPCCLSPLSCPDPILFPTHAPSPPPLGDSGAVGRTATLLGVLIHVSFYPCPPRLPSCTPWACSSAGGCLGRGC